MADHRMVRIGGASGAWGDSPRAIPQLLAANVDYLMMDYLAEVSMSLLARARLKAPEAGYPPDFIAYLKPHLAEIAKRGIKIVTNAGGVNPAGCAAALQSTCHEQGLSLRIAVIEGDDVLPHIAELRAANVTEAHSGIPIPAKLLTANAYLGALPIKAALDKAADIVITGRCADSALALGILMHEFNWADNAYNLLASGSLAGHLLECGAQGVGGLHTDWACVPDWANIGYPIAECHEDGSFILTKPENTGGLVTPGTAAEQTLYEIGDPASYILPDLIADFSNVTITQQAPHRVLVRGARGRAPTTHYKVSATYQDGYRAVGTVSIVGPQAALKAERTGQALLERARLEFASRNLEDFTSTHIEALGAEASYGPNSRTRETREALLRIVVVHKDPKCIELFAREFGSVGISMAPGTTGIYSGRPKATPQIKLFTMFIEKTLLTPPKLHLNGETHPIPTPVGRKSEAMSVTPTNEAMSVTPTNEAMSITPTNATMSAPPPIPPQPYQGETTKLPLIRLALARSGDKGNAANIAIIARHPALVETLRREVTAQRMATHFAHLASGPVQRFEAPGLHAFNFLLENALGGGGMASLRIDPQGKAYAMMALEMLVNVPLDLIQYCAPP